MSTFTHHAPGAPCWADLATPDPDKARAFYAGLFGWAYDMGGPESGSYAMCNVGGRAAVGIGGMPPGAAFPTSWTVYFAVTDVDDTIHAVRAHGGNVVAGPMDVLTAGRLAVCADPTGAVFGLWQARDHIGASVMDEPGALAWMEVNTRDAERARDFYCAVFGLAWQPMAGMAYYTLHAGDRARAGVLRMTEEWPADLPPHWMTYFAVADTDAAVAKAPALGGAVCVPAFDTPYGRIAVLADPMGATFSVMQAPAA